jgi:signal transduction histidine kinase
MEERRNIEPKENTEYTGHLPEKKWYQLLGFFLMECRGMACLIVAVAAIYAAIFSLYDVPVEPVVYSFALCATLFVFCLVIGFFRFYRNERARRSLLLDAETYAGNWKKLRGTTLAEQDYLDMIGILENRCRQLSTEWQKARQDSLDYYSTWVHQIKTPIAVMRMQLQGEDTEANRALLAELFRIEQYVEMVLSYIRLGSSQTDFVFQEYELDGIIRQAVHKYAPMFVHNRVRLVYEPVSMRVLTDEKWLLFLIEQILSNAIKYTPKGTVTIAVSPEQVLSISDTGIGIAPEDLPRIFEKGFTGYNGRADKKATGLGLYLGKQTADKLGIRLWAKSLPGAGSTFYLDLHREKLVVE